MDPVAPPRVGIARQGASNSCYINSSMQMLYCIPAVRRAVESVTGVRWTDAVGRIFRALDEGTAVGALVVPHTSRIPGEKSTFVVSPHVQSLNDLLSRTLDTALGQMGDPTQTILFAMGDLFDNAPTRQEDESLESFEARRTAILDDRTFRPELEKVTFHAMFRKSAKCSGGYTDGRDYSGKQWSVLEVNYFSVIQLKANECWSEKLNNGKERTLYPPGNQLIKTVSGLLKRQGIDEIVENNKCKGQYRNKIVYTVHSTCMYVMVSISRNRINSSGTPILGPIEADNLVFAVNNGLLDRKQNPTEEQETRSFRVIAAILFVHNHYVFVRINDNAEVTHYYDDDSVTIGIPQCTKTMSSWGITVARNAVQLLYRRIDASPDQTRHKPKRDEEPTVQAETSTERPDGYNDHVWSSVGSSYVIRQMLEDDAKQERLLHAAFTENERIAREIHDRQIAEPARIEKAQREPEVIDLTSDYVPTTTTTTTNKRQPDVTDLTSEYVPTTTKKKPRTHRVIRDSEGNVIRMQRITPKPKLTFGSIVRAASMYRA